MIELFLFFILCSLSFHYFFFTLNIAFYGFKFNFINHGKEHDKTILKAAFSTIGLGITVTSLGMLKLIMTMLQIEIFSSLFDTTQLVVALCLSFVCSVALHCFLFYRVIEHVDNRTTNNDSQTETNIEKISSKNNQFETEIHHDPKTNLEVIFRTMDRKYSKK